MPDKPTPPPTAKTVKIDSSVIGLGYLLVIPSMTATYGLEMEASI